MTELSELKIKWLEQKVRALELEVQLCREVIEIQESKITQYEMNKE